MLALRAEFPTITDFLDLHGSYLEELEVKL